MCIALVACAAPKECCSQNFKKYFKFATFYAAANGGNFYIRYRCVFCN